MNKRLIVAICGIWCALTATSVHAFQGCFNCLAQSKCFAEAIDSAEGVVFAKALQVQRGDRDVFTEDEYLILRTVHVHKGTQKTGAEWRVNCFLSASYKAGDTCLVVRKRGEKWVEASVSEVSRAAYNYAIAAPRIKDEPRTQIAYYLRHFGADDEDIHTDAYYRLWNLLAEIKKHRDLLDRRVWRKHFERYAEKTGHPFLELVGWCLGECGNQDDASRLKEWIAIDAQDFRLGLHQVMAAYVKLTGEPGLKFLEERKIAERPNRTFAEAYEAMKALCVLYEDGSVPRKRLLQSMRMYLDQPELADLAIDQLAICKDWSIKKRLLSAYQTDAFKDPSIRRAVVRFLFAMADDPTQRNADGNAPVEQDIADLRRIDPETVRQVKASWRSSKRQ